MKRLNASAKGEVAVTSGSPGPYPPDALNVRVEIGMRGETLNLAEMLADKESELEERVSMFRQSYEEAVGALRNVQAALRSLDQLR